MKTECNTKQLEFHGLGKREVIGRFDGGKISTDGGGILLREVEKRTWILKRFAECFVDYRDPQLIEHSTESLIKQRTFGMALGYEDINDHDELREDPLLALICDKPDPTGSNRLHSRDKGKALAGKSTLNRLELTPADANQYSRYKKIVAQPEEIDRLFVDVFLESCANPPEVIVLDVDATDDPLHGQQEGRFFHGYYDCYCYLPLYIFCGEQLLRARLREANQDASAGTVEELERIVSQIRSAWPEVRIILRGDAGFCREGIMSWCEETKSVDFVLGLAGNKRLHQAIGQEMQQAKEQYESTKQAARVFRDFRYQTLDSWTRERRVVGKAEYLSKGENPRFIVTSINSNEQDARALYEDCYCARGNMENRIKEQQLDLFADRTSTSWMRSNQLRLYFSSFAYIMIQKLRELGLKRTELAKAQCGTIRLKLFKIGAQIRMSVRRARLSFSESCPNARVFEQVTRQLQLIPLRI